MEKVLLVKHATVASEGTKITTAHVKKMLEKGKFDRAIGICKAIIPVRELRKTSRTSSAIAHPDKENGCGGTFKLLQQEVNVRLPGGTSGKTQVHVAGIPQFKVGERVVVFLEETRGGYIPSGLSQGVFRVEPFVLGTEKLVRRASDGAGYAQKSAGAGLQWVEPPAEIVHYPLVKLREEVRLYQRRPTTRVRRVEEVLPTVLP